MKHAEENLRVTASPDSPEGVEAARRVRDEALELVEAADEFILVAHRRGSESVALTQHISAGNAALWVEVLQDAARGILEANPLAALRLMLAQALGESSGPASQPGEAPMAKMFPYERS